MLLQQAARRWHGGRVKVKRYQQALSRAAPRGQETKYGRPVGSGGEEALPGPPVTLSPVASVGAVPRGAGAGRQNLPHTPPTRTPADVREAEQRRKEVIRRALVGLEDAHETWEVAAALQQLSSLGVLHIGHRALVGCLHTLITAEGDVPMHLDALQLLARSLVRDGVLASIRAAPVVAFTCLLKRNARKHTLKVLAQAVDVTYLLNRCAAHLVRPRVAALVNRELARLLLEAYAQFRHEHEELTALCLRVLKQHAARDVRADAAPMEPSMPLPHHTTRAATQTRDTPLAPDAPTWAPIAARGASGDVDEVPADLPLLRGLPPSPGGVKGTGEGEQQQRQQQHTQSARGGRTTGNAPLGRVRGAGFDFPMYAGDGDAGAGTHPGVGVGVAGAGFGGTGMATRHAPPPRQPQHPPPPHSGAAAHYLVARTGPLEVWEIAVVGDSLRKLNAFDAEFFEYALATMATAQIRMGSCRPEHLVRLSTGLGAYVAQRGANAGGGATADAQVAAVYHNIAQSLVDHWLPDSNPLSLVARVLESFQVVGVVHRGLWDAVCAQLTAPDSPLTGDVEGRAGREGHPGEVTDEAAPRVHEHHPMNLREDRVLVRLLAVLWWGYRRAVADEAETAMPRGGGSWLPVISGVNMLCLRLLAVASAHKMSQATAGAVCAFYITARAERSGAGQTQVQFPRSLEALARQARSNGLQDPLRMVHTTAETLHAIARVYAAHGDCDAAYIEALCDVVVWRMDKRVHTDPHDPWFDERVPDPAGLLAALRDVGIVHEPLEEILRERLTQGCAGNTNESADDALYRSAADNADANDDAIWDVDAVFASDAAQQLLVPMDPL